MPRDPCPNTLEVFPRTEAAHAKESKRRAYHQNDDPFLAVQALDPVDRSPVKQFWGVLKMMHVDPLQSIL
jgi:hypothetical protein